jgi:hypothetical protein
MSDPSAFAAAGAEKQEGGEPTPPAGAICHSRGASGSQSG